MESQVLEYIIKRKAEGALLAKRISLILGYIILFLVLAIVILNFSPTVLQIPFFLLDTAFCALIAFVSWKFVCLEYEIVLGGGEMNITVIYGKSFRHRILSLPINSLIELGHYDDAAYEKLCGMSLKKNFICVSSLSAPTIYYAIVDIGKDRSVIYFEADGRAIKYLTQQNSAAARAGNIQ